jgi:sugar phosphate isomerase/epimerase
VHISEPQLVPIQRGVVDHAGIAKHLREVGYDRWMSIEMLVKPPADPLTTIDSVLSLVSELYGDE